MDQYDEYDSNLAAVANACPAAPGARQQGLFKHVRWPKAVKIRFEIEL